MYSVVTILITIFGVTSYVQSVKKKEKKGRFKWQLGAALILFAVFVVSMCVHRFASKVPGVTNIYLEYAILEIKQAGLEYDVIASQNEAIGLVLSQKPTEGMIVRKNTVVTLYMNEMSDAEKEGVLTVTEVPTLQPTDMITPKPTNTLTPKPTNTLAPKPTNTSIPTPTNTPTPKSTNTPTPEPTNTPMPAEQKVTPFITSNPKSDGIVNVWLENWEESDRDIFGFTYPLAYKLSASHVVYALTGGTADITVEMHIPLGGRGEGIWPISFVVSEEMAGNGSYADVTILSGDKELEGPFRIESITTEELLYEIDVTGIRDLIIRFECKVMGNGFIAGIVFQ